MTTSRTHSIGKPVRRRLAHGMAVLALMVFAAASASVAAEKKKAAKVVVERVHTQMMSQTMPVIGRQPGSELQGDQGRRDGGGRGGRGGRPGGRGGRGGGGPRGREKAYR